MTATEAPVEEVCWPINANPSDIPLAVPTDILCSYHYFSDVDMAAIRGWGTRIIGDSGAFSAQTSGSPIDREKFHEWADRWRGDLFWTAALDVIGDQQATRANWQAAQDDGLNLVPTVHYGANPADLDWYIEQGVDFIGLGGMVGFSSEKARLMRWLIPMFRHVRDHHPHVRFHGWGVSHPTLLDSLPWWSTDSSGFASAFRFGTLRLWSPETATFVSVDLNGRDLAAHSRLLREHYGVDWKEVSVSTSQNRRPLGRLAIRAVQKYAEWLQSRQRVTVPASLGEAVAGPLTSVAVSNRYKDHVAALNPEGKSPPEIGPHVSAVMFPKVGQIQAITPLSAHTHTTTEEEA